MSGGGVAGILLIVLLVIVLFIAASCVNHQVRIKDEAIIAAVELSNRYISV